ncbi:hypothetical protein TSAR_013754 [Trichomalopsis sarcophagae]|uniref:Uncharacterized protein n=1 Tax=Trichomalopsis sarcophagae TaxID=543379 RepID=A0A232FML7_9HYME|nr:hypothetical protein TSAR_013754 [Trichomalopsis sarcophagae]
MKRQHQGRRTSRLTPGILKAQPDASAQKTTYIYTHCSITRSSIICL